jgi:hypothetical protein
VSPSGTVGSGRRPRHVDLDVVYLRYAHETPLATHAAVGVDGRDDDTPFPVLAEAQRLRVPGVGVALGIDREVVVTEESMVKPRALEVGGIERRVRDFAGPLPGKAAPLGAVEKSEVETAPVEPSLPPRPLQ